MRFVVSFLVAVAGLAPLSFATVAIAQDAEVGDPCDGSSTPEINACYGNKLQAAEAGMERYLQAATNRYLESGESGVVLGLANSQAAFEAYRDIECGTVRYHWREGTIRTVMELNCSITLTDQRTHAIWASWLTYPDSTPPTLPEPAPTE